MIKLWQILLLLLIVGLLVGGYYLYSHGPKPPRIVGDKLYLPENCFMARFQATQSSTPLVFKKFDQQYPEKWPNGFMLPAETYILSYPLVCEPARNDECAKQGYYYL